MASKMQSLRDRQIGSIEKILGLNHNEPEQPNTLESSSNGVSNATAALLNENGEPIWKVLVFDNLGRDIISSVLRVNDLRSRGVTIHL